MAPVDAERLVRQVLEACGKERSNETEAEAREALKRCEWNVQATVNAFYDDRWPPRSGRPEMEIEMVELSSAAGASGAAGGSAAKRPRPSEPVSALLVSPLLGSKSPLGMLLSWFESRDEGRAGGLGADVPAYDALSAQFSELCKRLRTAYAERPYSERWRDVSGVVIMKDVFTQRRFYEGCEAYLHLFAHCALKTMNEAVVECMGSVWDASADEGRHPSFEESVKEAVIAWSAPQPFHAEAIPFVNRSLVKLFGSSWSSHFAHVDQDVSRANPWAHAGAGGKVVMRKKQEKPRLPSSFYG